MRDNIWSFLCYLFFPLHLFSCLLNIMEVFMFKARTPPPITHPPTLPLRAHPCECVYMTVCMWARTHPHPHVYMRVCVSNMKGAHAAKVQSPVHVLKCSPRDGQHYPCLLHQQGPGARAGSWPFVSKQMEMGRGEVENWKEEEEE